MAAFVLIAISIGVDLYQVSVRCLDAGWTFSNFLQLLREFHNEVRTAKYLECIDEIYANQSQPEFHLIGIACVRCQRKRSAQKMICNRIENAIEVDGAEEAFEVLEVSKKKKVEF